MAVCPNVEYNSAPGAQVSSVIRRLQLSWENIEAEMQNVKQIRTQSFFNACFICGKIEKNAVRGTGRLLNTLPISRPIFT
jgi:hypothetical protein